MDKFPSRVLTAAVGCAVAAACSAVVISGPAAAAPDPTAELAATIHRQPNLLALADQFERAGLADPDYASTGIDPVSNSVVVYRVGGGANRAAYTVLSTGDAAVTYKSALLSAKQTRAIEDAVWAAQAELAAAGVEVVQVSTEGHGPVTIGVTRLDAAAAAVAERFSFYGPGTVRVQQAAKVVVASRQDDAAPYRGGGRIISAGGANSVRCTAGFGGLSTNGRDYMITAFHCVNPGDRRFWDGGNDLMGSAAAFAPRRDMAAIEVATAPRMWDGAWNSTSFTKGVTASANPRTGTGVCTSGSFSGVRCWARVGGWSTLTLTTPWGERFQADLWFADGLDGRQIVGSGDSGGPVFTPNGDNVTALGIISAMDRNRLVGCVGLGNRECSSRVFFGDVRAQAGAWSLNLTR